MEIPARVVVYCPTLELKNRPATLVGVSPHGYYEVRMEIAERNHTALLPISGTSLIYQEANVTGEPIPELER